MRDVLDASIDETAGALGLTAANVKVQHHRARKRLETYERTRKAGGRDRSAAVQEVLGRFLTCLASGDVDALEALFASDVRMLSDGGGEFHAARVPVLGVSKVARFLLNVRSSWPPDTRYELRLINGQPALLGEASRVKPGSPPRFVARVELDDEGRIREIHTILATGKLAAIFREPSRER
jgi:RNA polymerase sigma-70 factor (ECF subfamily)